MFIRIFALVVNFVVLHLQTAAVFAQNQGPIEPISEGKPASIQDLTTLFSNALTAIIIIGGFAAFLMLIFGGFRYLTARGDPKAVAAAQGTITWAVIGLAFIIFSWLILTFIADFTGLPLTTFCIPGPDIDCPGL